MLELQEAYYEIRFNFITVWQLVFHSGGFEALPSLRRLTRRWKIKGEERKEDSNCRTLLQRLLKKASQLSRRRSKHRKRTLWGARCEDGERGQHCSPASSSTALVLAMPHPSFTARPSAHRREFKTSSGHLFLPRVVDRPEQLSKVSNFDQTAACPPGYTYKNP